MDPEYKITYFHNGRQQVRRFDTQAEALRVAEHVYEATGVVVGIEVVTDPVPARKCQ